MSFESTLATIPHNQLNSKIRQQLAMFGSMIDRLGRLDEASQAMFVDDASFHTMVSAFFSPAVADRFVADLQQLADSRMLSRATVTGKLLRKISIIDWSSLTSRSGVLSPQSGKTLTGIGLNLQSTEEEVRKALQTHFPNLPAELFDPKQLHASVQQFVGMAEVKEAFSISSLWDCFVRNLGFWGAFAAVTAAIVISIAFDVAIVASGGIFGVVFWAAFWPALAVWGSIGVGFDVVVMVVSCLRG